MQVGCWLWACSRRSEDGCQLLPAELQMFSFEVFIHLFSQVMALGGVVVVGVLGIASHVPAFAGVRLQTFHVCWRVRFSLRLMATWHAPNWRHSFLM